MLICKNIYYIKTCIKYLYLQFIINFKNAFKIMEIPFQTRNNLLLLFFLILINISICILTKRLRLPHLLPIEILRQYIIT